MPVLEGPCVVIVDDNQRVLDAVSRMFRRRHLSPTTYSSFESAAQGIAHMQQPPDGALIDLTLERGRSGLDLARVIRTRFAEIPLVISSGYPITSSAEQTMSRLRATFIAKPISIASCRAFISAVTLNAMPLHSALRNALLDVCGTHDLGAQEIRIIGSMAAGSTRSRLASDLGISDNTVKFQIRSLLAKTGMDDTSDVLADVLRRMSSEKSRC